MRKKIALISILLFCSAFSRSTTFDDREYCEKSDGVWREFGNGCVDSCEGKLNQFSVCTMAFTYGCECGKSRCWDFDKKSCVALKDYKKIFDARINEEKKIAEAAKKKREEEAKENQQTILTNLDKKSDSKEVAPQEKTKPNSEKTSSEKENPATPANAPQAQIPSPIINNSASVPPLFLQQEKAKKDEEEKKKKEAEGKNKNEQEKQLLDSTIPGLPVIPLPQ